MEQTYLHAPFPVSARRLVGHHIVVAGNLPLGQISYDDYVSLDIFMLFDKINKMEIKKY